MKYKVVIIDDEPWTRASIKSLVDWSELDMGVVGEASDGQSGLSLVNQLRPDIIITDVKMPGIDGLELLRVLRSQNCHAKTIVISGYDDYSYIRNALKLNVTDYLLKPVKPEVLQEQLMRCVEQLEVENIQKEYDACAFMSVGWVSDYMLLREQLYNSLTAGERALMKDQIKQLERLIVKNEPSVSVRVMICIYYDLIHLLEQYIVMRGYTAEEIFPDQELSFEFYEGVTLSNMLDFVSMLYLKAADNIEMYIKMHNHVNVQRIKDYVDVNYTGSISLQQVASMFYISKEYLSKVFKQFTGQSFTCYITELRMKKAKSLICSYKVPIKDVVLMVGYADQAHFYKTFRKYYGMPPGELLKSEIKK